jgi:hypothetical protein
MFYSSIIKFAPKSIIPFLGLLSYGMQTVDNAARRPGSIATSRTSLSAAGSQQEDGNQRRSNLSADRVSRGSQKRFDLQVLFQWP